MKEHIADLENAIRASELRYLNPLMHGGLDQNHTNCVIPDRTGHQGQERLRNKCSVLSRRAFYELLRNGVSFSFQALIQTSDQQLRKFRDPRWYYHEGMLVSRGEEEWVFVSPANYEKNEKVRDKILVANSLNELFEMVQEREGGTWPSASFIENQIKSGAYNAPFLIGNNMFMSTIFVRASEDSMKFICTEF